MPTARGHQGRLRGAVLHYLAHGKLPPPHSRAEAEGQLDAFRLKHRWLARNEEPEVVDEMRELWAIHADDILAATPAGAEPWIVAALRSSSLREEENEP